MNEYEIAHKNADTDISKSSIHHTIGVGPNQAASGAVVASNKKELDGVRTSYTPRPNNYLLPSHFIGGGNAVLVDKVLQFIPFDVKGELSFQSVGFRLRTPASGGSVSLKAALYHDLDGGYPDLDRKIMETGSDNLTTGQDRNMAFNEEIMLQTGRYWLGSLYTISSSPTTAPTIDIINNGLPLGLDSGGLWFNGAVNPPLCLQGVGFSNFPVGYVSLTLERSGARFFALRRKA